MENNPLINGFGNRMRQERKRLGLTQEALADRAGVGQQTVLQYEKGNTSPPLQFIYSLHDIGFNMQFLLYGRETKSFPRDFPPEVIRYVANAVPQIEKEFTGGTLSNETKLRMMLVLLEQYAEQPSGLPLIDAQSLALSVRR
ncbi:transcriptional regulator with XRE-family HTH domain [Oxalobacteraceae bacterium GrIS 2.11]